MTRSVRVIALSLAASTLGGCSLLGMLGMGDLSLLGIMPAIDFADVGSAEHGKAIFALGGIDLSGLPLPPPSALLEIESDQSEVEIEDSEEIEGHDQGSLVFLADGSGSMYDSDFERYRVGAAGQMAKALNACAPDWRMALMEFGGARIDAPFSDTAVLVDFTTESGEIAAGAEALDAVGGTPLWDSIYEVLGSLDADVEQAFESESCCECGSEDEDDDDDDDEGEERDCEDEEGSAGGGEGGEGSEGGEGGEGGEGSEGEEGTDTGGEAPELVAGRGIVVLSDGQDLDSQRELEDVISRAKELGIPVHAVGLGESSDIDEEIEGDPQAIADLRRLAEETGGYFTSVTGADELPALAEAIAQAHCGGHTRMEVTFLTPPASGEEVTGAVKIRGTDLGVPFRFIAP